MTDLSKNTEIELAALADGSLASKHREEVLARVAGSPELRAALAEQQRAVGLTAAVDARAPESLRHRIETMLAPAGRGPETGQSERDARPAGPSRDLARRFRLARPGIGLAGIAAAAMIAVLVAIVLSAGSDSPTSSRLDVQQAAALTLSPATGPAPGENAQHRSQLTVAVGGVAFPYWKERFGWRSSGTRSDEIGGHRVTTVFYTNSDGRRIGYAIASGRAPATSGGTVVRRWGISYRLLEHNGATVVTWRRAGHLCVMAGRGVSARTLLNLASWGIEQPRPA